MERADGDGDGVGWPHPKHTHTTTIYSLVCVCEVVDLGDWGSRHPFVCVCVEFCTKIEKKKVYIAPLSQTPDTHEPALG